MKGTLREWVSRLAGAFGLGRGDRDIEEELQVHLTLEEDELRRQGMSPESSAREARIRSGRSPQALDVMRDRRGIPPLSTFRIDFRLGLRMLRKHWALTLLGGAAMTAAITVGASFYNFAQGVATSDLPLEDGDRVVILQEWNPLSRSPQTTSIDDFERWRRELRAVEDVGAFRTVERNVTTDAGPAGPVSVAQMSAAGFRVARVAPLLGRFLANEDEQPGAEPAMVLGYNAWRSRFASDPQVLGRRVQLSGTPYTVVGVMPPGFAFPVNHQFWIPLTGVDRTALTVFARLAPGAPLDRAQAEANALGLATTVLRNSPENRVQPRVVPYITGISGERNPFLLRIVPLLFALLLVPPCTNIGVLIYARTLARQGEFAARAALGASRTRIVVQVFVEVLLLALAAASIAAALAPFLSQRLSYMVAFSGQPFWVNYGLSYETIVFAAALALLAATIAGAIPALRATGRWKLAGLHALNRGSAPRLGKMWTAIVVVQVALSVAVVPASVEVAVNMLRPGILGPGFPADEFLTARLDMDGGESPTDSADRFNALRMELIRQLRSEPGIAAVTMSEAEPFAERNVTVETDLDSGKSRESVAFNQVDDAFFDAFGIPLLAGRAFEASDADPAQGSILVNRAFARRVFGGENPVGRSMRVVDGPRTAIVYEVVGMVGDQFVHSAQPTIYHLLPPAPAPANGGLFSVRLAMRTGSTVPRNFATRLRQITASIDPVLRIDDLQRLDEIYWYLSLGDYVAGSGVAGLALGILLFSVVGVYTLMSFAVVQRRREIGIRSALGASPSRLVAGIFRRVLVPVSLGAALGGLAAVLLDAYLSPVLFTQESSRLPWILPAAEAFVLMVGVLAVFGPARRALRIDAVEALREG